MVLPELPQLGNAGLRLVSLPAALPAALFTVLRFPGLADDRAPYFRCFAGGACLFSLLIFITAGGTGKPWRIRACGHMFLLFHAGACFLASECELLGPALWVAHALAETFFVILYGHAVLQGKFVELHTVLLTSGLAAGGIRRFGIESGRQLEEQEETQLHPAVPAAIVTMVVAVLGCIVVCGVAHAELFQHVPWLFRALQALGSCWQSLKRKAHDLDECLCPCWHRTEVEDFQSSPEPAMPSFTHLRNTAGAHYQAQPTVLGPANGALDSWAGVVRGLQRQEVLQGKWVCLSAKLWRWTHLQLISATSSGPKPGKRASSTVDSAEGRCHADASGGLPVEEPGEIDRSEFQMSLGSLSLSVSERSDISAR